MADLIVKPKEIVKLSPSFESHQFLTPLKCIIELSTMLLDRINEKKF